MNLRRMLLRGWLLLAAACGNSGPATATFAFDAITIDENPLPCMIVVNDDWVAAADGRRFVNVESDDVLTIDVTFHSPEVLITVAPLLVESGKVTLVPRSRWEARDKSGFMDDMRAIRASDPPKQLFILPRKT